MRVCVCGGVYVGVCVSVCLAIKKPIFVAKLMFIAMYDDDDDGNVDDEDDDE